MLAIGMIGAHLLGGVLATRALLSHEEDKQASQEGFATRTFWTDPGSTRALAAAAARSSDWATLGQIGSEAASARDARRIAGVLLQNGQFELADSVMTRATERSPNHQSAWDLRARLAMRQGDLLSAREHWSKAWCLQTWERPSVELLRAFTIIPSAQVWLDEFQRLQCGPQTFDFLIRQLMNDRNEDEAIIAIDATLERYPKRSYRLMKATMLYRMKRYQDVIDLARPMLGYAQEPELLRIYARSLIETEEYKEVAKLSAAHVEVPELDQPAIRAEYSLHGWEAASKLHARRRITASVQEGLDLGLAEAAWREERRTVCVELATRHKSPAAKALAAKCRALR